MSLTEIRTILVIRLSSIGDIVLTTPLLHELHTAFPGAAIDYCTKEPFMPLLAGNPCIASLRLPEELAGTTYDLVVDLQNNRRSRVIVSSLTAGIVRRYRKQNWKKLLLVRFRLNPYRDEVLSVVDRYRAALDGILQKGDAPCSLFPAADDRLFAISVTGKTDPVMAVCFGANHFTKRYPPEGFASVISLVTSRAPVQVLLLGGREDAPGAGCILSLLPEEVRCRVVSLAGETSLMQTAALLERSAVVLSNDTGLMHMASAFGRKLFVLFGSSVREFGFLPWRTPYELFEVPGLSCRPCSHIGRPACPCGHFRCMKDLQPSMIADRIIEALEARQP